MGNEVSTLPALFSPFQGSAARGGTQLPNYYSSTPLSFSLLQRVTFTNVPSPLLGSPSFQRSASPGVFSALVGSFFLFLLVAFFLEGDLLSLFVVDSLDSPGPDPAPFFRFRRLLQELFKNGVSQSFPAPTSPSPVEPLYVHAVGHSPSLSERFDLSRFLSLGERSDLDPLTLFPLSIAAPSQFPEEKKMSLLPTEPDGPNFFLISAEPSKTFPSSYQSPSLHPAKRRGTSPSFALFEPLTETRPPSDGDFFDSLPPFFPIRAPPLERVMSSIGTVRSFLRHHPPILTRGMFHRRLQRPRELSSLSFSPFSLDEEDHPVPRFLP